MYILTLLFIVVTGIVIDIIRNISDNIDDKEFEKEMNEYCEENNVDVIVVEYGV